MIQIVIDSGASLPPDILANNQIEVVPTYVRFGNEVFVDGVDLIASGFYRRLAHSDLQPEIIAPSADDFILVYRHILEANPEMNILSIHLSGQMSTTVEAARQAAGLMPGMSIHVFDSGQLSLGYGLMACEAALMAREGASIQAILDCLARMRGRMRTYIAVDTLEYLVRSGRIRRTDFLMGSLLEVRPILTLRGGVFADHGRYRTWPRALDALRELAMEGGGGKPHLQIGIMHGDNEADALSLAADLREALQPELLLVSPVGADLGVQVGPGAVCVCWYAPD